MKLDKRLKQIINKCTLLSFKKDGNLDQLKVKGIIKQLKKLPTTQSVLALQEYKKSLQRELNKSTLTVETSVKLSKDLENKIVSSLKSSHFSRLTSHVFTVSPSLLGGLKVKIGDTLIDASLKNKLDQLKERIINN